MPLTPKPSTASQPAAAPATPDPLSKRVRVAAIVGGIAGLVFAVFNLLTPGQALLGQIELASVMVVILPAIYLSFQRGARVMAENLLMTGAVIVFFSIAVLGGVQGTGLLWAFVIPFLAFFLKGQKVGLRISLVFVLACGVYFFGGLLPLIGGYNYGPVIEVQFLMALVFYTAVAALFNLTQSRQDQQLRAAHQALQDTNRALQAAHNSLTASNQATAASKEHFQFVTDQAPVLIAHCSRELRYRFVNKAYAALFAKRPDELIGKSIAEVLGPQAFADALTHMQKALAGETVEYELAIGQASGGTRYLLVRYQPERDPFGNVSGFVAAITEITRRKAAESALEEARSDLETRNLEISRILSTASHDLRQPAHALGLLLSSLAPAGLGPGQREVLARAQKSAAALQTMLDAYFDYSWALARSLKPQIEAVSVSLLFDELSTWFEEKARQEQTRLRLRACDVWVAADGLLLRRILLNLVSNALRYSPGGTVLLCCRRSVAPDEVRIEVRDNGVGISPDQQDKIFQAFYQVPSEQLHPSDGLGLGLSVVRETCEKLGLSLQLRSAPNKGSCFSLRLARVPTPPARQHSPEPEPASNLAAGQRVLVVEDDGLANLALSEQLHAWGYQVTACRDVSQALDQLEQGARPDILITDLQLPSGPNGLDCARLIRERLGRRLPACLITGDTEPSLMQQARAQDLGFLKKPFAPSKLRSWLQRQQAAHAELEA